MRKKISVIGCGFVGATTAQRIAERNLGDVTIIDIIEGVPQGKGLDMYESSPIEGFDSKIIGSNNFADLAGSDVVAITAGLPRKPGMTRDDLLFKNADIVKNIAENVKKYAPNAIVIVTTNPLDVMTQLAVKITEFAPNRVFGMAGILDSARFRAFISMELDISVRDIDAMVLGGHGDDMVPLPRYSTVSGIPITELMDKQTIDRLVERTRKGGGEIVNYLKTGSAYYAPSSAVADMVQAVICDEKRIVPCSAYLSGKYGLSDVYVGVPVKIGSSGIEAIIELKLSDDELSALHKSASIVKENVLKLNT